MKTLFDFHFTNWAGNVNSNPTSYFLPEAEEDLQQIVQQASFLKKHVRVVGGAHSWSPVASSDDYLVNLDNYAKVLEINKEKLQVRVQAGIRLKELNAILGEHGMALKQLGSISEQSIAGATATGTHGSGIEFRILSSAILSMRVVTGSSEIRVIKEDEALMDAFRVNVGALGIVSEITLQCREAFLLREDSGPMRFDEALDRLPELLAQNHHMKFWWFPHVEHLMVYRYNRIEGKEAADYKAPSSAFHQFSRYVQDILIAQYFFAFILRVGNTFPNSIPRINGFIKTLHLKKISRVARSYELFNVPMPPKHRESEYAIPVEYAPAALRALRKMINEHNLRVNFVVEIRFVKGDNYWISPAYGRDSCYIGGYLYGDHRWQQYFDLFEKLMQQYGGRPHWGKEFTPELHDFSKLYERWSDFLALKSQIDPNRLFSNKFTNKIFGGR